MDWKTLIRQVAPTLGAALGGPLAGAASRFLADNLIGKAEASPEEIESTVLNASPEQLAKIKEIELQFKKEMRRLDIDVFQLEVGDRSNARELFKVSIWPQIILSSIFVAGYFSVLYFLFQGSSMNDLKENPWAQGVLTTVLGVLTAAVPQILSFWFGSSMGSKEKTRDLKSEIAVK